MGVRQLLRADRIATLFSISPLDLRKVSRSNPGARRALAAWILGCAVFYSAAVDTHNSVQEVALDCVQPQLAVAGRGVVLTCGREGTVFTATSDDGGRTFTPLGRVATVRELPLGRRRGPRIAADRDALVVSAVVGRGGSPGSTGDLMAWRSSDRGATWAGPVRINSVPDAAREGLHALAAGGGRFVAVWLDLAQPGTRLFVSESRDGGRRWSAGRELYVSPSGSVCECCHPSVAMSPSGTFVAMFRNNLEGYRDMYVVDDSGRAERLGTGRWRLSACPMDGGGLAHDAAGRAFTIWRREQTIYIAQIGRPEQPLGDGQDAAIVACGSHIAAAWLGPDGLVLASDRGAKPSLVDVRGTNPTLASSGTDALVLAWQHGSQTRVRQYKVAAGL